ncbi:preprotein translocase subunit SecG [Adhaeribacter sp. BT258]|uniref:Protein-export membrane protein SecG n=1 Tax=Adhaeribacter terrigena TaxID=2793070 RepID=A0ABS1C315_9BACT|nr:preprotein translocase subunit SecG [Adhaeribacter terrigena]MBK0402950.1 preprotein translocase subunit SecG [Adhaeribacter terrigena]
MYIALVSIIIFVCVLLVLVVLAQNSKGGGLSGQFGGAGASQLMGVKRTGDLLEKLTWGFAITLVVLTLATHTILKSSNTGTVNRSVNQERAAQQAPAAVAPATTAPQGEGQQAPAQTNEQPAVATPEAEVAQPQNDPLTQPAE